MESKRTILIVDDDKILCGALQEFLKECGHDVSCCNDGLDAVKLAKQQGFDIIFIDYRMPGLKGDLVCRLIRHHRPNCYIVGFSIESKEQVFIDAGANRFIHKADLARNFDTLNQLVITNP